MPNWCTGDIWISGENEDIKKFLTEGVTPPFIVKDDKVIAPDADPYHPYVKDTHRIFFYTGAKEEYAFADGKIILPIMGAWDIDPKNFVELAKKYNLGFHCEAEEPGFMFKILFDVDSKGNITKNESWDYYPWEEEEEDDAEPS